jgi:hypothetical protein
MSRYIHILLSFIILLTAGADALAKKGEPDTDDTFFPYMQDDKDMKIATPESSIKTKGIQIGGWITPVIIDQREGSNTLTSSVNILKLYLKTYLWKQSYFYIRGKDAFTRYLTQEGDTYGGLDQPDNHYDLDLAYISMMTPNRVFNLSLGRKFYLLGTGLLLNGRGDGGEVNFHSRYLGIQLLGLYTGLLKEEDNPYQLDSDELTEDGKRVFAGGKVDLYLFNQTLYFLGLVQMDKGDEDPATPINYNSQYYGVGIKGSLLEGLTYHGEFIYEMGESYLYNSNQKEDIKAFAGIFNLYYFFRAPVNPVLIVQYAYGSGDSDRLDHRTTDSNTSGEDNGFLSFGTYVGGYALRPPLSNLHVVRGGFSVSPFSGSGNNVLRRMAFIAKYSLYRKDKAEAPIGSGEAVENSSNVGQGIDASLRWRIFHDLSFFLNYAVFLPGDAYASTEDDNKSFMMAGLNISF